MVLGLYAAAAGMVFGGFLAIYFGSDIIVMERGWTMVIAGSVFAATGALLAGVAMAVAHLQGLERQITRLADRLRAPEAAAPARAAEPVEPKLAPERGAAPVLGSARELAGYRDLEIAPDLLFEPMPPAPARDAAVASPAPPAAAAPAEPAPSGAPELAAADVAPASEAPAAPTVVGTYNSGGNFYTMYSDGSIEAETPAGRFRFGSLDELKAFIAAGGDKVKAGTSG